MKKNPIEADFVTIVLPCGERCLIDRSDMWIKKVFPYWRKVKTHVRACRYIKTQFGIAREDYYLHRLIFGNKKNYQVDHINRNGLDNRRSNLRFASSSQNCANSSISSKNTSGYIGVSRYRASKKGLFVAYITKEHKRIHLGYFETAEAAAIARDKKAYSLFGDYALLNFPERKQTYGNAKTTPNCS